MMGKTINLNLDLVACKVGDKPMKML